MPLDEASAKVREGFPEEPPDDVALPVWAGILTLEVVPGTPVLAAPGAAIATIAAVPTVPTVATVAAVAAVPAVATVPTAAPLLGDAGDVGQ